MAKPFKVPTLSRKGRNYRGALDQAHLNEIHDAHAELAAPSRTRNTQPGSRSAAVEAAPAPGDD